MCYTPGAGIRLQKVDTVRLDNVEVRCKEHGVMLGQLDAPFAYDRVIDVLTINNLYLACVFPRSQLVLTSVCQSPRASVESIRHVRSV